MHNKGSQSPDMLDKHQAREEILTILVYIKYYECDRYYYLPYKYEFYEKYILT